MLNRRRAVQTGLAAMGALATPSLVRAQKKLVKIRYNEVVRSVLYAPAYVALSKGFFEEAGFDISVATANGGDKAIAALIGGAADIALIGPEAAIYVLTSESPVKPRIFCGLTSTDGFMLVGRKKVDKFDWNMLKGAEVLGFRPGSTPILFFEAAMRQNGIDPYKDLKLVNNVGIAARVGSWLAGQNQYAIFNEPEAAQLELDGKAFFLASIGETVGFADYTSFQATDKYIRDNPDILQRWTDAIAKAMKWTAAAATCRRRQGAGALLPRRLPGRAHLGVGTLQSAQDLEDDAGDRARGNREIPGHPGAGPCARPGQAREVRRPRAA